MSAAMRSGIWAASRANFGEPPGARRLAGRSNILARDLSAQRPLALAAAGLAAGFACESRDPQGKALDWSGGGRGRHWPCRDPWGLVALPASGFHDKTVLGRWEREPRSISFVAIEPDPEKQR